MVATSNPLAVQAGLWALAEGGTAMDAALASDAVLGVVQPMSTGVGGDLFCLVDDGREVVGFNGSGAAPRALTLDACRRAGAWGDRSSLCVTVPGAGHDRLRGATEQGARAECGAHGVGHVFDGAHMGGGDEQQGQVGWTVVPTEGIEHLADHLARRLSRHRVLGEPGGERHRR